MRNVNKIAIHFKGEIKCDEHFNAIIEISDKERVLSVIDEMGDEYIYPMDNIKFIFVKNNKKVPYEIGWIKTVSYLFLSTKTSHIIGHLTVSHYILWKEACLMIWVIIGAAILAYGICEIVGGNKKD